MQKQENEIKQFRILGSNVLSCKYKPTNKGKAYFTFKPLTGASNKKKFFDDAFNWFSVYVPNSHIDKIKFQLQGCKYNINNNRVAILGLLKNLKKLKSHHFDNWSFAAGHIQNKGSLTGYITETSFNKNSFLLINR